MPGLRPALILLAFAALTLPLMPLQQLLLWTSPAMARALPMHYHRLVARLIGVRINIIGALPARRATLLVANHVSWLDIVVLSAIAPVSFVAKREVNGWPFFGALARLQRTVFVDRNRRHATGDGRDEIRQRLKAGDTLVLFPEGTSSHGRSVKPFKSSFFGAAELEGVSIQPVTLAYATARNLPMTRRLLPSYAWYGDMDLAPHLWAALKTGPLEVTVICHGQIHGGDRKTVSYAAESAIRRGLAAALHGGRSMG